MENFDRYFERPSRFGETEWSARVERQDPSLKR